MTFCLLVIAVEETGWVDQGSVLVELHVAVVGHGGAVAVATVQTWTNGVSYNTTTTVEPSVVANKRQSTRLAASRLWDNTRNRIVTNLPTYHSLSLTHMTGNSASFTFGAAHVQTIGIEHLHFEAYKRQIGADATIELWSDSVCTAAVAMSITFVARYMYRCTACQSYLASWDRLIHIQSRGRSICRCRRAAPVESPCRRRERRLKSHLSIWRHYHCGCDFLWQNKASISRGHSVSMLIVFRVVYDAAGRVYDVIGHVYVVWRCKSFVRVHVLCFKTCVQCCRVYHTCDKVRCTTLW